MSLCGSFQSHQFISGSHCSFRLSLSLTYLNYSLSPCLIPSYQLLFGQSFKIDYPIPLNQKPSHYLLLQNEFNFHGMATQSPTSPGANLLFLWFSSTPSAKLVSWALVPVPEFKIPLLSKNINVKIYRIVYLIQCHFSQMWKQRQRSLIRFKQVKLSQTRTKISCLSFHCPILP